MDKTCTKCGETKCITNFDVAYYKTMRLRSRCKDCEIEYKRLRLIPEEYHLYLLEKITKKCQKKEVEIRLKEEKRLRQIETTRIKSGLRQKVWQQRHPDKVRENSKKCGTKYTHKYIKKRLETDDNFRIVIIFKSMLHQCLRDDYNFPQTQKDLGCSIPEYKLYIESKFKEGMTWENRGNKKGCWIIQNCKVLDNYDLTNSIDRILFFDYNNFTPVWV